MLLNINITLPVHESSWFKFKIQWCSLDSQNGDCTHSDPSMQNLQYDTENIIIDIILIFPGHML
jgi:hypothetical protein